MSSFLPWKCDNFLMKLVSKPTESRLQQSNNIPFLAFFHMAADSTIEIVQKIKNIPSAQLHIA